MMPKKENLTSAQEFQHIKCLIQCPRSSFFLINNKLQSHVSAYSLMQLDQRGEVKGSMAGVDNLLIHKAIIAYPNRNREILFLPLCRREETI